jgi:hypothetical protein
MRFLSCEKAWFVLPMYPVCGLVLGLLNPLFVKWAEQQGVPKPGVATAISVNILLPALAVGLAVGYPRVWTALVGAVALMAGFALGLAVMHPPAVPVGVADVLGSVKPVMVLACVGYAVLGVVAALVTRIVTRSAGRPSHTGPGND